MMPLQRADRGVSGQQHTPPKIEGSFTRERVPKYRDLSAGIIKADVRAGEQEGGSHRRVRRTNDEEKEDEETMCQRDNNVKGSITIEAAAVLPIFLMAMIVVVFFTEVVRTQMVVRESLAQSGKQIALATSAMREFGDELPDEASGSDLYAFAAVNVARKIEEDSVLARMHSGFVDCSGSSVAEEDGEICLSADYSIRIPIGFFTLPRIHMHDEVTVHAWVGFENGGESAQEDADDPYVYVTASGYAYHSDPGCRHLNVSVRSVSGLSIGEYRNESGAKYYPCEHCLKGTGALGVVYITDSGTRYHSSGSCSNLKRSVQKIRRSEVGGRPACKRCGSGE